MSLLVRNSLVEGSPCDLLVEGDRIARTGAGLEAPAGCEILEAGGLVAVPSLVNAHAHSSMVLLRGIAEDMALMPWLTEGVWPVERRMTAEDAYWGLRQAALEMVRTGTTLCNDMYLFPEALAQAARDSGMRFVLTFPLIDGLDEAAGAQQRKACEAFFDRLPDCGPLSRMGLAGHSVYATCAESLRFLGAFSRERDLPLHIHLAETEDEDRQCRARTGLSPAAYLDALGVLGPRTLAAHCLWLDEADFDLLAERGVGIVHNPVSNMKLASGPAFDYAAARARGIPVLLGTDGAASNNSLDLFADLKIAGLLQKHHYRDPRRFPVAELLDAASAAGHAWFGTGAGRLEAGATADFLLVDFDRLGLSPCHDVHANLVYAGAGPAVDTTLCAGRVLMRSGRIAGAETVQAQVRARAEILRRPARSSSQPEGDTP